MVIKSLPVGQLEANCYVLADDETGEAIIVDPGDEPDRILELCENLDIKYIVLTHAHFDHAGAVAELKEETGAEVVVHANELPVYASITDQASLWGFSVPSLPEPDITVNEGDEISIGQSTLTVIHTPGHTPGSMCLYAEEGIVITGDTLFAGSIGRTDFPGGSMRDMRSSFRKLMGLPDATAVFSGHGTATSIGTEKEQNMFAAEFLG
jgi:glyoxylase-like metal-dependent hydrolase (beta-lactamase superfamily II)